MSAPEPEEEEERGPFDGLDDDDFTEEEDGELVSRFRAAFERMRANGKEVMVISLEDLDAEVKARAEERRRQREAAAG